MTDIDPQIPLFEAFASALSRGEEILKTVEAAADHDEAIARVAELMNLSPQLASAVLDLQLFRFTKHGKDRIASGLRDLRKSN